MVSSGIGCLTVPDEDDGAANGGNRSEVHLTPSYPLNHDDVGRVVSTANPVPLGPSC